MCDVCVRGEGGIVWQLCGEMIFRGFAWTKSQEMELENFSEHFKSSNI